MQGSRTLNFPEKYNSHQIAKLRATEPVDLIQSLRREAAAAVLNDRKAFGK